jgi:tRNA/rRNA methyltransferase
MTDNAYSLLDDVHVVLLRPRWARNLGSVARAMKNFGLHKLTIVDSQIGSWNDAYQMAVQANDILEDSTTTDLTTALSESNWVVGTTNEPPPGTRVMTPREVAELAQERGAPTLLFGGEINGLDPAELLRCQVVSVIPTASAQSSLNISQAVGIYGAELYASCDQQAKAASPPSKQEIARAPLASTEMLQRVEESLRRLLENSDWIKANRPKNSIAALMQPLYRADLTEKEVHAWLVALGKALPR